MSDGDVLTHAAIGRAADAIRGTGSAVEIGGVRIEECDEFGATVTTRERDRAVRELERVADERDQYREALVEANRQLDVARTARRELMVTLASPPSGWFVLGSHIDDPDVDLEFWGNDAGVPLWERPAAPDGGAS